MSRLPDENNKKKIFFLAIAFAFFVCKFGHQKLPIKISGKLLQLVVSDLVSWRMMVNRLPGEQDGEQANGWGHSVSWTQFLATWTNSVGPGEMQHFRHFMRNFTVCESIGLRDSGINRVTNEYDQILTQLFYCSGSLKFILLFRLFKVHSLHV